MIFLWDSALQYRSRRVFNSLKDSPLDSRVDFDNFCPVGSLTKDKVHDLFEMTDTFGRLGSQWKTGSFILAEYSFSDYFTKLTCVSAVPTTQGGKQLRASQKISTILASWLSSFFKSWRAEFSWDFGKVVLSQWVRKGGNIQNSESVNKTSKVDVQSAKSFFFCFSKLFHDRLSIFQFTQHSFF